jgi:TrmH RNA methyltransferase
VATSSHTRESLFGANLPGKVAFLFGSETDGLSDEVFHLAERRLTIPGSGAVESLNVACAAAVVLGAFWQQRRPPPMTPTPGT